MIEIKINNEAIDLPSGFSIEIEDTNPIFNDRGSQSIPATVPATRRNARLLDFPMRIDSGVDPNRPEKVATLTDGAYIRRGLVNITSAGYTDGITFNLGFDNSTAYNKWCEKKLSELSDLPDDITGESMGYTGDGVNSLVRYLEHLYKEANPQSEPLAVFPIALGKDSGKLDDRTLTCWELLNVPSSSGSLDQPGKIKRIIDGTVTDVTVPAGYGLTAFIRIWRLLEFIFSDLGMKLDSNPFRQDIELSRLVVLNNTADAICTGKLRYSDLLPDCTVSEFLNALWVRFGLVYNVNFDTGRVSLRLIRDIIKEPAAREVITLSTAPELINYNPRQYVKLSAKSSIEGAAPVVERFEDYVKGLDVSKVKLGSGVGEWKYNGNSLEWDGDRYDSYWDYYDDPDEGPEYPEPDYPEPDDDRDDERDYRDDDRDEGPESRNGAPALRTAVRASSTFLAREFVTGTWHKLDEVNNKVYESSTGFFNWDPATPGLEPLDLASDDEWVPIIHVSTGQATDHFFNGNCPGFFVGSRHYHSFIKGNEDAGETGETTPLAFMIAYTFNNTTVGRVNAEGSDGQPLFMDADGNHPTLSLLFQFKDGLFAQFWAGYDEILRHGNRSVELPVRISKTDCQSIDLLTPVTFRGVRCLIDTISYSFPGIHKLNAEMKLRTITTHGDYDIHAEQNIPDFAAAARHLEWAVNADGFTDAMLDDMDNRKAAAKEYIRNSGYTPHGDRGDWYDVTADSAVPVSIYRSGVTWDTDAELIRPGKPGAKLLREYMATLIYDIFELHDLGEQGEEDWEWSENPIGRVNISVKYQVELIARWVLE